MRGWNVFLTICGALLLVAACGKRDPDQPPPQRKPTALEQRMARQQATVTMPDGREVAVRAPTRNPLYRIVDEFPRDDYERNLNKLLVRIMNPEALQIFCAQWYPDSARAAADAYREWRERNAEVIGEVMERSTAIWSEMAGPDTKYVPYVYPHLRKQLLQGITREFDASPAAKFRDICARYPADMQKPQWVLAKSLRREIAVMRERPRVAVAATPPASP